MTGNVYVGNMSYHTTRGTLLELFEGHGQVTSVEIVTDRSTGRPRGFAFVEMATPEAAAAAIAALNGQQLDGRALKVNEAKPRNSNSRDRRPSRGYRERRGRW